MSTSTFPLVTTTDYNNDTLSTAAYASYSDDGTRDPPANTTPLDDWPYFDLRNLALWSLVLTIGILGVAGNALQFVLMRDPKLSGYSYSVYFKFLSFSDTLLLVLEMFRETEKYFQLTSVIHLSDAYCKVLNCLRLGVTITSPWLVVGLTLDRHYAICFPMRRELFCTRKKALVVCFSLVAMVIAINVPPLVLMKRTSAGKCIPAAELQFFFIFFRAFFTSTLPCLLILVLNITIFVRIQRSKEFRKTFAQTTTTTTSAAADSANQKKQQHNPTRPLVIVSVLAFVTLLPMAVADSTAIWLDVSKVDERARTLALKLMPVFSLIYLLNFAQNVYILIASAENYREIMRGIFGRVLRSFRRAENSNPGPSESNICDTARSVVTAAPSRLSVDEKK